IEAVKASPDKGRGPSPKAMVEGWKFAFSKLPKFSFAELLYTLHKSYPQNLCIITKSRASLKFSLAFRTKICYDVDVFRRVDNLHF
ncbi:MAG: hypothetical protein LUH18_02435, partial [Oscillospiraceae bacterium]|nr:hypothetical protein [Oscillospiraceae bacterium]